MCEQMVTDSTISSHTAIKKLAVSGSYILRAGKAEIISRITRTSGGAE